ncbi:MAG: AMP-binding protein, partial [Acidimicrobiales bacterium]
TINRHLAPDEAAYLVDDSGATALVTTKALEVTAAALLPLVPNSTVRLMIDGDAEGFEKYENAVEAMPAERLATEPRGQVMLYSSGTTGQPKGIWRPISGKSVDDPEAVGTSRMERLLLGMDERSIYLCPAPLYHSAGLLWTAGVHELGGTAVIMEKFEEIEFLNLVARERVTHAQVVPTMFVRLLKLSDDERLVHDLSSLQCIVHAAAPCPVEVKHRMIKWLGPIVLEYYAATEGAGLTFITSEEWLAHPGSVGRAIAGIVRICDEEGAEVPVGQAGTVYFEQPVAPFVYHNDPEKTRSSRHPEHDNWSTTGDVGYLDSEGYLYLTDRRAFTIISGGVNIYPAEIESCMVVHPAVADVAVFGLPDPVMGEYVHAVVQLADPSTASPQLAEELRRYARERLAGYKVPRIVDFRDALPRLPTGKLQKGVLRDQFLEAGRSIA